MKHYIIAIALGLVAFFIMISNRDNDFVTTQDDTEQEKNKTALVQPECSTTDPLHVRIADQEYVFPRKVVIGLDGDYRRGGINKTTPCQIMDEIWNIPGGGLILLPAACQTRGKCDGKEIVMYIRALSKVDTNLRGQIFTSLENLLETCRAPIDPYTDWHARVWSKCRYAFGRGELYFRLEFRGGHYPPENIDQTIEQAMALLKQYEIPQE